jgi:hypothetical protein
MNKSTAKMSNGFNFLIFWVNRIFSKIRSEGCRMGLHECHSVCLDRATILTTLEAHFVPLQSSCHPLLGGIHRFAALGALRVFHRLERHFDWRGLLS